MLDVFNGDAFTVQSLTDAIIKAPYKPGRIGGLGLFRSSGITTTTVVVEEKDGRLSLIPVTPRGGPGDTIGSQKRTARSFVVPHLERDSTVLADQVQNVRAFGSENATEAVQTLVNERLADLRAMHEVTLEHMRAGAIKGQVLDSDGSTVILDLFTEFGVSQQTFDIDLSSNVFDVRSQCVAIQRLSEAVLGAEMVTGYRAFCGDDFFDALISSDAVKETLKYQESALLRADLRKGFEFGGITWENYRGRVGAVDFFAEDRCYAGAADANRSGGKSRHVRIRRVAIAHAAGNACDELDCVTQSVWNCSCIDASLKAITRVSRHSQLPAGSANAGGIERCYFKEYVGRRFGDFASLPANDSGNRCRLVGIGNHGHRAVEDAIDTVERRELLSVARATHDDLSALDLRKIECVHRLAESMEHVIRHVHDVADRPRADCFNSRRKPVGTWSDCYASNDRCHVARSSLDVLDADFNARSR